MADDTPQNKPRDKFALALRWRILISVLLVIHVTAIALPPLALQSSGPMGSSPIVDLLLEKFRPYIDVTFLNHGYAFFAPNPGPSHLIRARITFDDGRPPVEEIFPDLTRHWPRLLYHRHFMLSEQLNSQYEPPELPPELQQDPIIMEGWLARRTSYERKWRSFEEHLRAKYNATNVELTRVRHRMIDVFEVADEGKPLDAPDTFIDLREDGALGEELEEL